MRRYLATAFVLLAFPAIALAQNFTRPLIEGSTGSDVTALQQILVSQGYLNTTPTGFFGTQTAAALAKFQTAHGIEALGGVGPQTRNILNALGTSAATAPPSADSCALTLKRNLSVGSKGADVTSLQQTLVSLGFLATTPSGYFGSLTSAAVKAFQASKGLETVGSIGPKTKAAFASLTCGTQTTTPTTQATTTSRATGGASGSSAGAPSVIQNYIPPVSIGGGGGGSSAASSGGGGGGSSSSASGGSSSGTTVSATTTATTTTPVVTDTTPPSVTITAPTANLAANTTSTLLSVTTNETASCAYSTSAAFAFAAGTTFTATGNLLHTATLSPLLNATSYTYYVKCKDTAGNISGNASVTFSVATPADTTAPSTPAGVTAAAISSSQINVAWTASTDNVGVSGYQVFRNGTQVGTPTANSYSDSGLTASTAYTYTVKAVDAAGNVSAASTGASATTQAVVSGGGTGSVQAPGPSLTLFTSPYYVCNTNYYVSTTGNDSNNGTSAGTPWKTLQKASIANTGAGSCINVSPGTYNGAQIVSGGNNASASGYVVFRCTTMDGCTVTGNAGPNGNAAFTDGYCGSVVGFTCPANGMQAANYVMVDGFTLAGQGVAGGNYSWGFGSFGVPGSATIRGPHHVWILNSIVHDFGESGIAFGSSDYLYALHDTAYNNSQVDCGGTQGSGIAYNSLADIPSYAPTADDQGAAGAAFGFPTWNIGGGKWFHTVAAFNVSYNNSGLHCTQNTDANGIIYDSITPGDNAYGGYIDPELTYGNVVYNNGSGGVHLFGAANVYVANNTIFNNFIDPNRVQNIGGSNIDDYGRTDKTDLNYIYNNISVACTSAFPSNLTYNGAIALGGGSNDPAVGNLTYQVSSLARCATNAGGGGTGELPPEVSAWSPQTYSRTTNFLSTDPLWAGVSFTTPGTITTQPASANFALAANSPAIGKGTVLSWMPAQSADLGACSHTLTNCGLVNTGGGGSGDTTAPTTPASLLASAISSSQINLTWTASTDNVGVTGYKIFRGGVQVGTSPSNSYSDSGLTASTQYTYTVSANDAAGNNSAQSSSASATTQAGPVDTTPPVITLTAPSGQLAAGTTQTTLSVTTNESATCAWSNTSGTAFSSMSVFTTTGGTSHSTTLTGLTNGTSYTTYVKCKDTSGNISTDSSITYSVAASASTPVTYVSDADLANQTGTNQDTYSAFSVTGANPVIIVTASLDSSTGGISSIVLSGGLTSGTPYLCKQQRNGSTDVEIWAIPAPLGSGTITVNYSVTTDHQSNAALFNGANQNNPCASSDAAATTGSGASLSVTPLNLTANDVVVYAGAQTEGGDSPHIANGTEMFIGDGTFTNMSVGYRSGTGTVNVTWGVTMPNEVVVGVRLHS